eukprot:g12011.t1
MSLTDPQAYHEWFRALNRPYIVVCTADGAEGATVANCEFDANSGEIQDVKEATKTRLRDVVPLGQEQGDDHAVAHAERQMLGFLLHNPATKDLPVYSLRCYEVKPTAQNPSALQKSCYAPCERCRGWVEAFCRKYRRAVVFPDVHLAFCDYDVGMALTRDALGDFDRLTDEQKNIVEFFRGQAELREAAEKGFVRIQATAGSGKSTTCVESCYAILEADREIEVAYAVFNREMQRDAFNKLKFMNVACHTFDSFAWQYLCAHVDLAFSSSAGSRVRVPEIAERPTGGWLRIAAFWNRNELLDEKDLQRLRNVELRKNGATGAYKEEEMRWIKCGKAVWDAVVKFCQSGYLDWDFEAHIWDKDVAYGYDSYYGDRPPGFPTHAHYATQEQDAQRLLNAMRRVWKAVVQGKFGLTFEVAVKLCHLDLAAKRERRFTGKPIRFFFVDEFQDMSPVQLAILRLEAEHCLVAAVGDPVQSIYGFRGATRAFSEIRDEAARDFPLTQSFRFGPKVCTLVGDKILKLHAALLAADNTGELELDILRPVAADGVPSTKIEINHDILTFCQEATSPGESAVIVRSNREAIMLGKKLLDVDGRLKASQRCCLLGNPVRDVVKLAQQLRQMYEFESKGQKANAALEYDGEQFETVKELVEYYHALEAAEDGSRFSLKLIRDVCQADLASLSQMCDVDPSKADVVIATGHQSKGREWDRVYLDAGNVAWNKAFGVWKTNLETLNLFYVVLTRARKLLMMPQRIKAEQMQICYC